MGLVHGGALQMFLCMYILYDKFSREIQIKILYLVVLVGPDMLEAYCRR